MDLLSANTVIVSFVDIIVVDLNDCSPNQCQNGGTCTEKAAGFTCECAAGYNGDNCESSKYTYKCITIFNELKRIAVLELFRVAAI